MKKQIRPDEPQVLRENAAKWNEQWSTLKSGNHKARFSWYQINGRSAREWILPVLRVMNQAHCSFCDSFPLEGSSNEPIEHFKPKSDQRFYNLAYTWDNLFYSCEFCQNSKRERWDDDLIAPDAVDYEFSKYFVFDFATGAISPNLSALPRDQVRAQTTIDYYDLDTDSRRRGRLMEARIWCDSTAQLLDYFAYRNFIAPEVCSELTNTRSRLPQSSS
jgi:uncharacterized protein (TIGR02646 family)